VIPLPDALADTVRLVETNFLLASVDTACEAVKLAIYKPPEPILTKPPSLFKYNDVTEVPVAFA